MSADRPNLDTIRARCSEHDPREITPGDMPALVAALDAVLAMCAEWSELSALPEYPTLDDFAKASPAQRTLWEAAENMQDAIHEHIETGPKS